MLSRRSAVESVTTAAPGTAGSGTRHTTQVTDEGIAELQQALPNCEITK